MAAVAVWVGVQGYNTGSRLLLRLLIDDVWDIERVTILSVTILRASERQGMGTSAKRGERRTVARSWQWRLLFMADDSTEERFPL